MDRNFRNELVTAVTANFPSFGGGQTSAWGNPISIALRDRPPQFAAGVDIGEVVDFISKEVLNEIDKRISAL